MFQYSRGRILLATCLYQFLLLKNKGKMASSILTKWEYLHNERVFCYEVLLIIIIHQDLSFSGFALKIELAVLVYESINYSFIYL